MKGTSKCQTLQQFIVKWENRLKPFSKHIEFPNISHLPLTLSSLAVTPTILSTIPVGKQEMEGSGDTTGQDIVIGAPDKRSGST